MKTKLVIASFTVILKKQKGCDPLKLKQGYDEKNCLMTVSSPDIALQFLNEEYMYDAIRKYQNHTQREQVKKTYDDVMTNGKIIIPINSDSYLICTWMMMKVITRKSLGELFKNNPEDEFYLLYYSDNAPEESD